MRYFHFTNYEGSLFYELSQEQADDNGYLLNGPFKSLNAAKKDATLEINILIESLKESKRLVKEVLKKDCSKDIEGTGGKL